MMVLVVSRIRPEGLQQHLVNWFEFPGALKNLQTFCGDLVAAPVHVVYNFIGNLTHLCEACRVAWYRLLPDQDHVRVATDLLQERGVTLDADVVGLLLGAPKALSPPLAATVEDLGQRVKALQAELAVERRTTYAMRRTTARLAIGTLVRTWPDDTGVGYTYYPNGGQRHDAEGRVHAFCSSQSGYIYEVTHQQYPDQNGYYERHELVVESALLAEGVLQALQVETIMMRETVTELRAQVKELRERAGSFMPPPRLGR